MKTLTLFFVSLVVLNLLTGCASAQRQHNRRMEQIDFQHEERMRQIKHADEEAREAEKAGIRILQPDGNGASAPQPPSRPPQSFQSPSPSSSVAFASASGVPQGQNPYGTGLGGFLREWRARAWTITDGSRAGGGVAANATGVASGRFGFAETGYERQVKAFNGGSTFPSLATGVPSGTVFTKPGLNVSVTLVGAAQARSGLDEVLTGRRQ